MPAGDFSLPCRLRFQTAINTYIKNEIYKYDIGTPGGALVTSPYYNLEMGRTMVYPNVINVRYIHYKQTIRILIIGR